MEGTTIRSGDTPAQEKCLQPRTDCISFWSNGGRLPKTIKSLYDFDLKIERFVCVATIQFTIQCIEPRQISYAMLELGPEIYICVF